MNEKIDWEQRLRDAGMPEELPPVGQELAGVSGEFASESKKTSFEKEILDMPDPVMKMALEKFGTLPEDMQGVIIEDIKNKKETNMPLAEIKDRICRLVEGTYKMVKIKIPDLKNEEIEEEKEEGDQRPKGLTIDELIEKMEKISQERSIEDIEDKDSLVN